jgi:hypothetical protein
MSDTKEDRESWLTLYTAIKTLLDLFGDQENDYWLVDDDWGWQVQQVEFQNLDLLRPEVIKSLQALLAGYPDWLITVRIGVPGKRGIWPGMGLRIYWDKIVDDLKREYLPAEFRDMRFD